MKSKTLKNSELKLNDFVSQWLKTDIVQNKSIEAQHK